MKINRSGIYSIVLIVLMFVVYKYREHKSAEKTDPIIVNRIEIQGQTMGVTYQVVYYDSLKRNFKTEIDELLEEFNNHLSTYIPTSELSKFNQTGSINKPSEQLLKVLKASQNIYDISDGKFDPTVMPLVNLWGFGYKSDGSLPDTSAIDSVQSYIGFEKVTFNDSILSAPEGIELGFGAIAKGYGVDLVGNLLEQKGLDNFCVTIGGENVSKGTKPMNTAWKLMIVYPEKEKAYQNTPYCFFNLKNKGAATSGPYAQEKEINGIKYSHTINPKSGFPVPQEILSITIIADDCMTADGIATAMSVMSIDECKKFLKSHPEFESLILYRTKDGISEFVTDGMEKLIIRK